MTSVRERRPHYLLVIEDNTHHAELITELLDQHCAPIVLHTVDTFDRAFSLLDENAYDLILTDSVIQGKQIKHEVGRLKQHAKGTPIIIVTGSGNERVAVELTRMGVVEYLVKTRETLEGLPEVVKRHLRSIPKRRKKNADDQQKLVIPPQVLCQQALQEIDHLMHVAENCPPTQHLLLLHHLEKLGMLVQRGLRSPLPSVAPEKT